MKVGNSVRTCGIEEAGRCGIYGANSPEWLISMEACNAHGLYCVPLYDTLGAGAVEFIICHAEVTIAFVEEKKIPELLKTCPSTTKSLKTIVSFGKVTSQQREEVEKFGVVMYSWDEFLLLGENKHFDLPVKKKTDICTIMYTSGTTGDPKGVMISNNNIITLVAGVKRLLGSVKEAVITSHIFDRVLEECCIHHGASIGLWRGDVKLLVEDIAELKPTIFCAVPWVLDRIYSGLKQKISSGGFIKQTVFNFAYSLKLRNLRKGMKYTEASPLGDKIAFNKIKEGLGGNVRLILSGAAPLASLVEEFLRVVSCSYVLQGYGLTETCAGTFVSIPGKPRGEVCIRGDTLFSGYFKREDLTKEVLIDGWFHTGDIGAWQPNGSLKIIDRKKNIFKLSQGEYVAVENLENIYGLVSDIDSIWVYGNSFESFLVAVVNPKKEAVEQWAAENGISGNFDALCKNARVKEFILGHLTKIAKEKKLKGFEFIKALHLDPVPFDMERDLLTPTFKRKRPQLLKYYQGVIDNMYKSVRNKQTA
ncbi:unnamed protein product [Fraxinus pennsylvanica]|uniref:AMP-dependent synthetase/ligase domain-containing protein n=1 Tax=Fraxinus pennsylvanica TaxID=56036 RepID=A0AAD2E5P6_9LAMI|nr:unnamed protein product [Fraxinus pennsylvanica]